MRMFCILLLSGLLAVNHTLAQEQSDFQIRSYAVPVQHQGTLQSILGEAVSLALGMGAERRSMGVSSPAPGLIVVTAPPRIHEDIARFLEDFEPADPVNVRTEYWIISGEAGPGAPVGPELYGLAEVLNTITQAQGEMTFSLIEHAEMLAQAGSETAVLGIRHGEIAQTLNYQGGKIIGKIDLMFRSSELSTELAMEPGQFIVLGRSSLPPPPLTDISAPDQNQDMFFILRSRID